LSVIALLYTALFVSASVANKHHTVRQGLCNGTVSACLSVGLFHSPTAAARGGFAAVAPWAGDFGRLLHGASAASAAAF